ncbi:hypothetical protein LUZ60_010042 [Juncus effusus]|nr:hypothetical protein LUZ60_010042 [Juncus effusus]
MSWSCDLETTKWLLRLPLAFLSIFVSLFGCCIVILGLMARFIFKNSEFPKVITQLGLMLMETPCYVMRTCNINNQQNDAISGESKIDIRSQVFEKLPEPTRPASFNTIFNLNSDQSQTSTSSPSLTSMSNFSSSQFTFEELSKSTDNFSSRNLLGEGGFGWVYKGELSDGKIVAIKMLKGGKDLGAENEFKAETAVISRVHHKHLVELIGYFVGNGKMILVFEFVSNKTLQFHLHESASVMDWKTRVKIAIGSAKGLAYLHEECKPRIIHRDVKAANILLDESFEPKVGDFGLAKFIHDDNTHVTTRVMGTIGYLAPEYASTGQLQDKSDVFSFGVMLLELFTGQKPVMRSESPPLVRGLVDWARPLLVQAASTGGKFEALIDPRLESNYDVDEMKRMIGCAGACIQFFVEKRPHMSQVVRVLEGILPPDDFIKGLSTFYQAPESISLGLSDSQEVALSSVHS